MQPHGSSSVGAQHQSFTASRIFDYGRQALVVDGISALFPSWCECSKQILYKSISLLCFLPGGVHQFGLLQEECSIPQLVALHQQ